MAMKRRWKGEKAQTLMAKLPNDESSVRRVEIEGFIDRLAAETHQMFVVQTRILVLSTWAAVIAVAAIAVAATRFG